MLVYNEGYSMSKELILLIAYLALLGSFIYLRKTHLLKVAAIAFVISSVWVYVARDIYLYNVDTLTIGEVNMYALVAWSLGLLVSYLLYLVTSRYFKPKLWWQKLIVFNGTYVPILLLLETVAYHVFNVVNVGTATYSGISFCDCLHAPTWMKWWYILAGSVFMIAVGVVNRYQAPFLAMMRKYLVAKRDA